MWRESAYLQDCLDAYTCVGYLVGVRATGRSLSNLAAFVLERGLIPDNPTTR